MFVEHETIQQIADEVETDFDQVAFGLQLNPVGNQLVILRHKQEKESTSKGGIVLSQEAVPRRVTGVVLAVGPGMPTVNGVIVPPMVKRLDRVRFRENFGEEMTVNGHEFYVIKESDVMVVLP